MIWKAVLLFIVGLICLVKGGDWFVDGAVGIARRFKIPEIIIGATVVSIGTTLPEVMVSSASAATGHGELAYGNAVGSVICNVALIAAITLAVKPAPVDRKSFKLPVIFFFIASAVYLIAAYFVGGFTRIVGIILLCVFVVYIVLAVLQAKKSLTLGLKQAAEETEGEEPKKELPMWKILLGLVVGAALIAIGAQLLVDNGTTLATAMGVPESVIALTLVALGTSLPELTTAITSLIKGHGSLSLGNIVGANLFDLVLVTGLSSTISPFTLPQSQTLFGINSSLVLDLPLMVFVMAFLTVPALITQKLYRFQGIILLCIYAGFCALQFVM